MITIFLDLMPSEALVPRLGRLFTMISSIVILSTVSIDLSRDPNQYGRRHIRATFHPPLLAQSIQ